MSMSVFIVGNLSRKDTVNLNKTTQTEAPKTQAMVKYKRKKGSCLCSRKHPGTASMSLETQWKY